VKRESRSLEGLPGSEPSQDPEPRVGAELARREHYDVETIPDLGTENPSEPRADDGEGCAIERVVDRDRDPLKRREPARGSDRDRLVSSDSFRARTQRNAGTSKKFSLARIPSMSSDSPPGESSFL
jgi:hypothetical protein